VSREVALDNIRLRPCERWAHTEYSLGHHKELLKKWESRPPRADAPPLSDPADPFCLDFNWGTHDGPIRWGDVGRVTDMGHAVYAADGSDRRESVETPFKTPEDVWAFDAVTEYGLPDADELVQFYEEKIGAARRNDPKRLSTGGYYSTIVSGAIAAFGWDMLLLAASDQAKMEKVLDSFFRRTLFHMEAWAKTSVEACIQHDDFVWSAGPFMAPEFYRKVIIPRYAELWKPLHAAGKKLLFCSDGDFTEFVNDVAEAGADGFIFEPMVDFGMMAERFGASHCLVGSFVDCRDMTFGKWDKVKADIDRTLDALEKSCKGAIVAVGNHLPPNIPMDIMEKYFDYLVPRLGRSQPG